MSLYIHIQLGLFFMCVFCFVFITVFSLAKLFLNFRKKDHGYKFRAFTSRNMIRYISSVRAMYTLYTHVYPIFIW